MSHHYESGRPGSYYDNYGDDAGNDDGDSKEGYGHYEDDRYDRLRNEMLGYERAKSPTQTISLLTTVPQNITASDISGKHAPTRNSLRHSRMIVMNRTGNVPTKSTPPVLRFDRLAKALVGLQTLVGLAICFVAFWVFLWTPNINARDNPFWSGLPLLLSGIVGLTLLCCFRKEHPGMRNGLCVYSIKTLSIFLGTLAGTACLISSAFSSLHVASLSMMECESSIELNATCLCRIGNDTSAVPFLTKRIHYVDLQCPEVDNLFVLLLIFSCATNFIGAVVALWYVYLHWASRYTYTYSKVHTDRLRPTIVANT